MSAPSKTKEFISAPAGPELVTRVFSPAIKFDNMVYCSGTLGLDPATMDFVPGTTKDRARQALLNLQGVLEAAGSSIHNILKVNVFLTTMDNYSLLNDAYVEFFADVNPMPCRTCVAVYQLPLQADVEIECTAFVN